MRYRRWVAGAIALGAVAAGLWALGPRSASADGLGDEPFTRAVIPWGSDEGEVGIQPEGHESPAQGVATLAVHPDGSVLLLDRLNRRVVRVGRDGAPAQPWVEVKAPADAEEIAVSSDGTLGLFSPLRATVWVLSRDGEVETVMVPRGLREVTTIDFGLSHQVIARSAHQETYRLGSPAAPQSLAAVLHSKQEGAYAVGSGLRVAARLGADRTPELLVIDDTGDRASVVRRHRVASSPVLSATIVGVADDAVCIGLERRIDSTEFRVSRWATCIDSVTGETLLDRDLGPVRGSFVPRRSLALGGSPPRLVFMQPGDDGLELVAWQLPRSERGTR